jgi:hypothetical protein
MRPAGKRLVLEATRSANGIAFFDYKQAKRAIKEDVEGKGRE